MSNKSKLVLVPLGVVLALVLLYFSVSAVFELFFPDKPGKAGQGAIRLATATATPVSASPTLAPTFTALPSPTPTLVPTATPAPTPTLTPAPTATPVPLPTPTPPFNLDEPKVPFIQRFNFRKTDVVNQLRPGVIHVKRQQLGPININILLFDLTAPELNLKVAFQDDWLSGVARTSTLAKANNALAAVNGDLFSANGLPQGMAMSDGKLALAPKRRATFAYSRQTGPLIGLFTQGFTWPSSVVATNGERHSLEVLNSVCKENWLCLYNDLYRQLSASSNDTRVLVNPFNVVTSINQEIPVKIPTGYQVLLGRGESGRWLLANVKTGDKLELNLISDPDYHNFEQIISGGPVFLRQGEFVQDCMCFLDDCSQSQVKGILCEEFTTEWKLSHYHTIRMPRNGIGYNEDKTVLISAVVDGYQPGFSIGMTQKEFGALFQEFGAESAMELDGGGSATMWVDGKLANHPSDGSGGVERMVPNALIFQWNYTPAAPAPDETGVTPSPATATATSTSTPGSGQARPGVKGPTPTPTPRQTPGATPTRRPR